MPSPRLVVQDGVTVVTFDAGPHTLDETAVDEVRDAVLAAALAEPPRVVIDLTEVEFFGSSFIELMFRLWKRLQDRSGRFALCGASSYCREVLAVTKLERLWQTFDTRDEAVRGMNVPQ